MSAREIWECSNCDSLFNSDENCTCDRPNWNGAASQAALTSTGYRLVAPGSFDPETLEAAAKVAEDRAPATQDMTSTFVSDACDDIAAAIRALKDK